MQHSIMYRDQEIRFSVRVNRRARRIILKVSNEGEVSRTKFAGQTASVTVTIPRKNLEREAIKLVQKKASWVLGHQKKIEREVESRPKVVDQIMFLGNNYPVNVVPSKRLKLKFLTNKFELGLGEHTYEDVRLELKKWYTKQARQVIPNLVENFGYKDRVKRIAIRGQKTCWGSCSSRDNLNFNWRLMMAPMEVVNYVVSHELAHMTYMDHSAKFWNAVQEKCPDYRRHKGWLKEHGKLLKF